jgi:hypothetical protein
MARNHIEIPHPERRKPAPPEAKVRFWPYS